MKIVEKIAEKVSEGINKLGWTPDVPNSKGEMLFSFDCHECMTIAELILPILNEEVTFNYLANSNPAKYTAMKEIIISIRAIDEKMACANRSYHSFDKIMKDFKEQKDILLKMYYALENSNINLPEPLE